MGDYFNFDGRVSRLQFWVINIVISLLFSLSGLIYYIPTSIILDPVFASNVYIYLLIPTGIAYVIVSWTTIVKRVRDTGLSPWWSLITVLPGIGIIAFIAFGLFPSYQGELPKK